MQLSEKLITIPNYLFFFFFIAPYYLLKSFLLHGFLPFFLELLELINIINMDSKYQISKK